MTKLPGGIGLVIENGCAFLAHWLLVIPLTIPWIVVRRAHIRKFVLPGLLFASVLSLRVGWVAFPAIASLIGDQFPDWEVASYEVFTQTIVDEIELNG